MCISSTDLSQKHHTIYHSETVETPTYTQTLPKVGEDWFDLAYVQQKLVCAVVTYVVS